MDFTVGLFGTCDGIRWRDPYMKYMDDNKIPYFNPMVDDWSPDLAHIENQHLLNDEIILFPVLKESLGFGSLSETGFSILQAIQSPKQRSVIIFIDSNCEPIKQYDANIIKLSCNARQLVKTKIELINNSNIFLVNSLEEMWDRCLRLITIYQTNNHHCKICNGSKFYNVYTDYDTNGDSIDTIRYCTSC